MYRSQISTVRITINRPISARLTPTNKAKKLPPKPPNVKLDFKPTIHRNYLQIRSRNPHEPTK